MRAGKGSGEDGSSGSLSLALKREGGKIGGEGGHRRTLYSHIVSIVATRCAVVILQTAKLLSAHKDSLVV